MTTYAIAYSDKNGRDFCGELPWLLDDFSFEKKRKKNEEFTWDYVKAHKI